LHRDSRPRWIRRGRWVAIGISLGIRVRIRISIAIGKRVEKPAEEEKGVMKKGTMKKVVIKKKPWPWNPPP